MVAISGLHLRSARRDLRLGAGVPAFAGLGAGVPAFAGLGADITDTIPGGLSTVRADGGATVSDLLMQTQADLLGRPVEAADVPEISALGAAELAWSTLGATTDWSKDRTYRRFDPYLAPADRAERRAGWSAAVTAVRTP
ncbi:FGGY-family carbohydrate kinase [Kribbella sp. NPDC059898]|uniref:FGGY-family carbohydrate kinase n=1 Tax=Kribbella sp. NPDC059898 TaxID=3346995 RepID=UPI0036542C8B